MRNPIVALLGLTLLAVPATRSPSLSAATIYQSQGFLEAKPGLKKNLVFNQFDPDRGTLQAVRLSLAREIEQVFEEPLVLCETLPAEDVPLVPGPIVVEIRGVAHPKARVQVNDKELQLRDDGAFRTQVFLSVEKPTVTLTVEHAGRGKELTRTFSVYSGI